jgi:catechol 2,3-dioxygenase-like lactoylglutathione lyase family enzyme
MTRQITFDHCVIHVSDWQRSNAFYEKVLGAEIVPVRKGFAYRFGPVQLNCHGPDHIGTPRARVPVMPGNSDICFEWNGAIAGAIEHLQHHGVAIELGPLERGGARGKGTSIYFRDPDGSLLELISYA